MWQYNPYTNSWIQVANFGGTAREGASAFVLNGEAYVCCGFDNAYNYDVWKYSPGLDVGINEVLFPNAIHMMYPSPTTEALTVVVTDKFKNGSISISDIEGKIVLQQNMSNQTESHINVDFLKQGVYTVSLIEHSKIITSKKIIKTN